MGNRGIFYRQLVTPSVVVSAVSTVTMITSIAMMLSATASVYICDN